MFIARGAGAGARQALSTASATAAAAMYGDERMNGVIDNETRHGVESCRTRDAKYPLS
jgi:hypothetical protein